MSLTTDSTQAVHYRSQRTHRGEPLAMLEASYQPSGTTFRAQPSSLEYWLTARDCLYSADRQGHLYRGEISHPPWSLSSASWQARQNSMCDPLGIELSGQPHLLAAAPIEVRAWLATRCK